MNWSLRWTAGLGGLVMIVLSTVLVAGGAPVLAGAVLVSSMPADGSRVITPPARVDMIFGQDLGPTGSIATVSRLDGTQVDGRDSAVELGNRRHLSVSIGALTPGTYTVHWHADAADNSVTDSNFTFVVVDQSTAEAVPPAVPLAPAAGTGTTARTPLPPTGRPADAPLCWLLCGALLIVLGSAVHWRRTVRSAC